MWQPKDVARSPPPSTAAMWVAVPVTANSGPAGYGGPTRTGVLEPRRTLLVLEQVIALGGPAQLRCLFWCENRHVSQQAMLPGPLVHLRGAPWETEAAVTSRSRAQQWRRVVTVSLDTSSGNEFGSDVGAGLDSIANESVHIDHDPAMVAGAPLLDGVQGAHPDRLMESS